MTAPAPPTFGRPVPTPTGEYRWVYLWGWPLRAMHWLAALAILVLAGTGFYIGRPYFVVSGDTADHFVMGWMRFIHFTAASVLVATVIVRVYWLFAGNKFERWVALFPVRPKDWVNMVRQVKYYLMIHPEKAPHYLGHNPLQQFSYTGIYLLAVVEIVTGFTLYGQSNPGGLFYSAFAWVVPLLGGLQVVRFVHHVVTWVFLIFIPIHVYLATRSDIMERGGAISSIITGGKFVPAGKHFVDE
jgi:Ni/Fe-hydrogenase b-type cytochrome subunit